MIARNIFANNIGVIGQIAIAFLLAPFLVRVLGDINYGIWSIIAALSGYMSLLDMGIASSVTRYVSKYNAKNDYKNINIIVNSALLLTFIISVCLILLSPIIADLFINTIKIDPSLKEVVGLLIIIVSFDMSVFIITGLFRGILGGLQRFDFINIATLFSSIVKALLFYVFLNQGYELLAMAFISIFAKLLLISIYLTIILKRYNKVNFKIKNIEKKGLRDIYHHSKYTFISMLSNQLIYYSDTFIIAYFLGPASVTYYTISWSLSAYVKRFAVTFGQAFTPAFSESENNEQKLTQLYLSGTKHLMIFSNLLCIGIFVLGGEFIGLWMGTKYQELCTTVLVILITLQFVQGPQLISIALLQGLSRHKTFSTLNILVSIMTLSLSIYLVQIYGIVGVAIGATLPQIIFYGLVVPLLANQTINCSFFYYLKMTYLKLLIPNGVLFAFLYLSSYYLMPDNFFILFFNAIISAVFYLIATYYTALDSDEKKYVRLKINTIVSKVHT